MKKTTLPGFKAIWYVCYYFKWGTSDYLSRQIMDFKADQEPKIAAFGEIAKKEILTVKTEISYVIRVLGSKELTATKPNRVRSVAIKLADALNAPYHPLMIRKNRVTKELKSLNKDARKKELEGVYELNDCPDLGDKNVLIVDDIFTFGTSLEAIGEVLTAAFPSVRLYGFALAHNWPKGEAGIFENEPEFVAGYKETLQKIKTEE